MKIVDFAVFAFFAIIGISFVSGRTLMSDGPNETYLTPSIVPITRCEDCQATVGIIHEHLLDSCALLPTDQKEQCEDFVNVGVPLALDELCEKVPEKKKYWFGFLG